MCETLDSIPSNVVSWQILCGTEEWLVWARNVAGVNWEVVIEVTKGKRIEAGARRLGADMQMYREGSTKILWGTWASSVYKMETVGQSSVGRREEPVRLQVETQGEDRLKKHKSTDLGFTEEPSPRKHVT